MGFVARADGCCGTSAAASLLTAIHLDLILTLTLLRHVSLVGDASNPSEPKRCAHYLNLPLPTLNQPLV
jgi:hypothetical protein